MDNRSGIRRAVEKAGSAYALARQLSQAGTKVLPGSVAYWLSKDHVPAAKVEAVSELTGIPVAELNPSLARVFGASAMEAV